MHAKHWLVQTPSDLPEYRGSCLWHDNGPVSYMTTLGYFHDVFTLNTIFVFSVALFLCK